MSGEGRRSFARKVRVSSTHQQEQREALIINHVCSYAKELLQKLKTLENLEDACSLMGLVTVYRRQLQERTEFFRYLLLEIYKILEDAAKDQFRVVLLHLIELIASNGDLSPLTTDYYKRKALLSESCEDAFKAAWRFGEEIELKLDSPICSPQSRMICPSFPEGGDSNGLIDSVKERRVSTCASSPISCSREPSFIKQEVNNNDVDEDNLAEVFGECIQSALSNVSVESSLASRKALVKAEEEKGTKYEAQSQILPSSITFDPQSNLYMDNNTDKFTAAASVSEVSRSQDMNSASCIVKEQSESKIFKKLMKVNGDVTVLLSSHSKLHLKEVYDFLDAHFCSRKASVNQNTQATNEAASGVLMYSRKFLLQCSAKSQSKVLPFNWDEISRKFPEILSLDRGAFSPDNYYQPLTYSSIRQDSQYHSEKYRRTMSMPNPERGHANGCESYELLDDDIY